MIDPGEVCAVMARNDWFLPHRVGHDPVRSLPPQAPRTPLVGLANLLRPQRSLVKFKFGVFFLGNTWSTRSGASESDLLELTAVTAASSFSCAHCVGLVERLARLCFAAPRHVETIFAVKKNEHRLVQQTGGCRHMICRYGHEFFWCCMRAYRNETEARLHRQQYPWGD